MASDNAADERAVQVFLGLMPDGLRHSGRPQTPSGERYAFRDLQLEE